MFTTLLAECGNGTVYNKSLTFFYHSSASAQSCSDTKFNLMHVKLKGLLYKYQVRTALQIETVSKG